jgi:glycosyltransferase involved in cell wall biosynthesis
LPIEWLGAIYDDQKLQQHFQQSSIFVYPSLADQGEAMPIAPLEAMACGAVPIVSDLACFRDFITPGMNGLVFNHRSPDAPALLASQLINLATNAKQRAAMGQAAQSVRQSHDPAVIARDFLRCFEEMLQQHSYA